MEAFFNTIGFFYINFSFPLFFLIFIFVFRENIINLSERLISIEKSNSGARFNFANTEYYLMEFDELEHKLKEEFGDSILDKKPGGGGNPNGMDNSEVMLIYNPDELLKKSKKLGFFETIEELFVSYKILKKINDNNLISNGFDLEILNNDLVLKADKLIKGFYQFSMKAKLKGEFFEEKDIFNYQNLIKETLNLRQNLCIKKDV